MILKAIDPTTGYILHSFNSEPGSRQSGPIYALCLLLYLFPPEERDALIAYILSLAMGEDQGTLSEVLNRSPNTIRIRFNKARKAFDRLLKATEGKVLTRKDLLLEVSCEDEEEEDDWRPDFLEHPDQYPKDLNFWAQPISGVTLADVK